MQQEFEESEKENQHLSEQVAASEVFKSKAEQDCLEIQQLRHRVSDVLKFLSFGKLGLFPNPNQMFLIKKCKFNTKKRVFHHWNALFLYTTRIIISVSYKTAREA